MRRLVTVGLGLAMTVATIASAPAAPDQAHYVDAVGDANGVSGYLGEHDGDHDGADTRPLSLDGADVVAAWYSTSYVETREVDEHGRTLRIDYVPTALQLHVETARPASPSFGPTLSYDFYGRISGGDCYFGVRLVVRGPASTPYDPGDGALVYRSGRDCAGRGLVRVDGLAFDGTTMTATFPFAEMLVAGSQLAPVGATIAPDDEETSGGYVSTSHGDPDGIEHEGKTIDVVNPPRPYRIGEDVPASVDCIAAPTPACD